jgi:hypothetical protein
MRVSKKIGCLLSFVLIPLFLILLFIGMIAVRESFNRAELNRKLNELAAAGKPIDDKSLDIYYRSLADSEHATEWMNLFEVVNSKEFLANAKGIPVFDPDAAKPTNPEILFEEPERVRAFLQSTAELRDRIRVQSLEAKPVQFPIKFASVGTLLPQTNSIRHVARLIFVEGEFAIHENDSQGLAESINTLYGISLVCSEEPFLVSKLVCNAVEWMYIDLVRKAVEVDVLRTEEIEELLEKFAKQSSISSSWRSAVIGERAAILAVFQNPQMLPIITNAEPMEMPMLPARSADALFALELFQRAEEANPENPEQFRAELNAIDEKLRDVAGGSVFGRLDSLITTLALPAMNSAGQAILRQSHARQFASIGLAIRLYEDMYGNFPTELQKLNVLESFKANKTVDLSLFGYRLESEDAVLWGCDYRVSSVPPPNPPESGESAHISDIGEPIWHFRKSNPK